MSDYVDDVTEVANGLSVKPVVMGWSMGGLVALMAAATGRARACVALSPTPPAAERDGSVEIRRGVYGSEEYGIRSADPAIQPAMRDLDEEERSVALGSLSQESRSARDERKAGVVISSMPCPLLLVTGSEDRVFPLSEYAEMGHWGRAPGGRASVTLGFRGQPARAAESGKKCDRVVGREAWVESLSS